MLFLVFGRWRFAMNGQSILGFDWRERLTFVLGGALVLTAVAPPLLFALVVLGAPAQ
jgi:hypothetical protein